jgi:hypothetical protein
VPSEAEEEAGGAGGTEGAGMERVELRRKEDPRLGVAKRV